MGNENRGATPCIDGMSKQAVSEINPQRILMEMKAAGCCCARTRVGAPCKNLAMRNGRCRMHGGASTGPKTALGLARARGASVVHGGYGTDQRQFRDMLRSLKARAKRLTEVT